MYAALQVRAALSCHTVLRLPVATAAPLHLPDHPPLPRALGLQDPPPARPQDVGQGGEGRGEYFAAQSTYYGSKIGVLVKTS